jgi:hypothetical protein
MKRVMLMVAVMGLCAIAAGTLDAQGQGRRGGGAGGGQGRGQGGRGGAFGGTGPIQLVQNKDVLEDVKATDEQKTKLADWAKEAGPKLQAKLQEKLQDVPMEERFQKMAAITSELNKDLWKEIDTVLKPEQTTRVKQIYVQALGVRAFTDTDVVAKLKLTDDQKGKIKEISDEYTTKSREIRMAGRGGEEDEEFIAFQGQGQGRRGGGAGGGQGRGGFGQVSPETQKKLDELTKETMTKIKAVLTYDQKKEWGELTGKEFDVAKLRPAPRGGQ